MIFFLFAIQLTITPETVALDKTVTLEANLTYQAGEQPDIDVMRENLLYSFPFPQTPPFSLIKETIDLPRVSFILEPQIPGEHTLSFGAIPFGQGKTLETEPFSIQVQEPTIDPFYLEHPAALASLETPYPIAIDATGYKNLFETPPIEDRSFPWKPLVALLALGAAVAVARIKKVEEIQPQKSTVGLRLQSIGALAQIEAIEGAEQILERYLDEAYKMRPHVKTTREIILAIEEEKSLAKEEKEPLIGFFSIAEKIKYAKARETGEEEKKAVQIAKDFFESSP